MGAFKPPLGAGWNFSDGQNSWFPTLAPERRNAGSSTSLRFAQNDSKDGHGIFLNSPEFDE
jgi:hypothetical protein